MKFSEMPYSRIDVAAVLEGGKKLIERAARAKNGEEQWEIHKAFYEMYDHVRTNEAIASIRRDINMEDAFYAAEGEFNDEAMPQIQALVNEYQKVICASPYRSYVEEKIGPVPFKSMELAMKAFDDKLIPLMQEENKLCTRYAKLIASASIDWDGEKKNLSLLKKYMTSADRSVRERAWKKHTGFFEEHAQELDEIYDLLVKNRTAQARALGYENYIEMGYYRMNRNSYGRKEIENLRRQVKEAYVPFAEAMHENRRKRLQVDHLYYYDEGVYFPDGNPAPEGTPEEILANGMKMYSELSEETRSFFRTMRENELFDVLGRKAKRAGGYEEELPDYRLPFIFANFNGTSGDVDVITHECGHAFQYYTAAQDPIKDHFRYLTMETAEIHSMSMEFFTEPWMELFFGEKADLYRQMHLEDSVAFVPYGCMVDEFQHIVYEHPEMTPGERKAAWVELEKQYRPHMDCTGCGYLLEGGFWQKQQHIYVDPFYYIDYVLAQLCAFQYKIKMDENYPAAWESYLKLFRLASSEFYPVLLQNAGLRAPFEDGCVADIVSGLEKKL